MSTNGDLPKTQILGVKVDRVTLAQTLDQVTQSCISGDSIQIVTVNLNFVTIARRNLAFRTALNSARIAVADGRFVLWLTAFVGEKAPAQITGHDLLRECVAIACQRGWSVYLLGGAPGVAAAASQTLKCKWPTLSIDASDGGHFTADGVATDHAVVMKRIHAFQPKFLFVALGAPKQDLWISRHLVETGVSVAIGVGGVFDTLSGSLPRAPKWMQVSGLESVFQLLIEPRRYARRYLLDDPPTLVLAVLSILVRRLRARKSS